MDSELQANTKAELLRWMSAESKTFKWGALLAFDRATANSVFRERYIDNFNSDSYLPEISLVDNLVGTTYVMFDRCVLGEPRLSFKGAKIISSEPTAQLTLEVIGGREVVLNAGATTTVVNITELSSLNAPLLEIDLNLQNRSGGGYNGLITVDLSSGHEYRLSLGNTHLETTLTGDSFQKEIAKWNQARKTWVLNSVKSNAGPFAIDSFEIRTQAAPGAASRTAENYGDGAVVAFIKLVGGEVPQMPGEESQFRYLVPNDAGEQYTATFVISETAFMSALDEQMFRVSRDGYVARQIRQVWETDAAGRRATFLAGALRRDSNFHIIPTKPGEREVTAQLSGTAETDENFFTIGAPSHTAGWKMTRSEDYRAMIEFHSSLTGYRVPIYLRQAGNESLQSMTIDHVQRSYWRLYLSSFTDDIQLMPEFHPLGFLRLTGIGNTLPYGLTWQQITDVLEPALTEDRLSRPQVYDYSSTPLNVLPLQSFLFGPPYSTRLSEVFCPRDLVMFGHLAPQVTAFQLATPLHIMAASNTHVFEAVGSHSGLAYTVENLPGESTPTGTINASTGAYTAPTAAQLKGAEVRARIRASKGGYTASAIVTVVPKKVSISPIVQFVTVSSNPVGGQLSAGSLGDAAITWGPVAAERGSLINSDAPNRDKVFLPPADRLPRTVIDLVPVTVSAAGETGTGYVAVLHYPPTLEIVKAPIDVNRQTVQLTSTFQGDPWPAVWEVVEGPASFSATTDGLLIVDTTVTAPFVLVIAKDGGMQDYLLLPLPLAEFPPKPRSEARQRITLG